MINFLPFRPNQYEFDLWFQQYDEDGGKASIYSTTERIGGRQTKVFRCFDPEFALNETFKQIQNNPCFVGITSGLGLVNAAMASQILLSRYSPENLLVSGIAGTNTIESPETKEDCVCDVVVPSKWAVTDLQVQMSARATPEDPIPLEGVDYIREWPASHYYQCPVQQKELVWTQPSHLVTEDGIVEKQFFFDADEKLLEMANQVASSLMSEEGLYGINGNTKFLSCPSACRNTTQARVGGGIHGGSSNTFLANAEQGLRLLKTYNISVVDMETAAAAQVATTNNVAFIGIRGISDSILQDSLNTVQDETIDIGEVSMRNAAALLNGMVKQLCIDAAEIGGGDNNNGTTSNVDALSSSSPATTKSVGVFSLLILCLLFNFMRR